MARDSPDLWNALARGGESMATEEDYEHGYKREVRQDLQQYVAFRVAGESYGLSISQISEISKVFDTTPVPRTSDFVIGIGNVRGSVIPIIDLGLRLQLRSFSNSRAARVLIVRHEDELYGLVVDEVLDVVTIAPEELEEAPGAIAGARGEYIRALTRLEDDILIVLELSTVLLARDFIKAAPVRGPAGHPRRASHERPAQVPWRCAGPSTAPAWSAPGPTASPSTTNGTSTTMSSSSRASSWAGRSTASTSCVSRRSSRRGHIRSARCPMHPPSSRGSSSSAGVVIPVIDLRKRFAAEPDPEYRRLNKLIIVSVRGRIVGLRVDRILGELRVPAGALRPAPSMLRAADGAEVDDQDFFSGVCRVGNDMVFVVNLETIIDPTRGIPIAIPPVDSPKEQGPQA